MRPSLLRCFNDTVIRKSVNIRDIVLNTQPKKLQGSSPNSSSVKDATTCPKPIKREIPSAYELMKSLNHDAIGSSKQHLSEANRFFNVAAVKYEWSVARIQDLPGMPVNIATGKRDRRDTEGWGNGEDDARTTSTQSTAKTYQFNAVHRDILPEIAFLGRCNVGKSTLLNNLTTAFKQAKLNNSAKVSKRAGFTKTINSFNVGNKFRLIDTPGYGVKSTKEQGDLITAYLRGRKELKLCFLLIAADIGFIHTDYQIIDFLNENGVHYDVVFTKLDKVKSAAAVEQMVKDSGILNSKIVPQLLFVNSATNKRFLKRQGIDMLRHAILLACNIEPGTIPTKAFRV